MKNFYRFDERFSTNYLNRCFQGFSRKKYKVFDLLSICSWIAVSTVDTLVMADSMEETEDAMDAFSSAVQVTVAEEISLA